MNYLSGFLRQTLNQSFQEYVAAVRFNYACERMVKTDDKLLTICMDAGFPTTATSPRLFRKGPGKRLTPTERFCGQAAISAI